MPCSATSDLGLHCLPMTPKTDTRLIWINKKETALQYKGCYCHVSNKYKPYTTNKPPKIKHKIVNIFLSIYSFIYMVSVFYIFNGISLNTSGLENPLV